MEQMLGGRDPASLSQEERQKMFQEIRGAPGGQAGQRPGAAAGARAGSAGESAPAAGTPPVLSFARSSGQFTAQQRAAASREAAEAQKLLPLA